MDAGVSKTGAKLFVQLTAGFRLLTISELMETSHQQGSAGVVQTLYGSDKLQPQPSPNPGLTKCRHGR